MPGKETPEVEASAEGVLKADKGTESPSRASSELPPDVRAKLKKLETMQSKYQGMCISLRLSTS